MASVVQENEISFIVTYRDREEMLRGYLRSIQSFYPTSQIIISEQCDDKPFLQGQLFNLGYKHSDGKIIVLMDVDIRFRRKLDIVDYMQQIQHPFLAYSELFHCDDTDRIRGVRGGSNCSNGGCCVFTREQFEASCGYSNLIVGWGGDDDIMSNRVGGFRRIDNVMFHIQHPRMYCKEIHDGNAEICRTEHQRDKRLDGFRQTTGRLVKERTEGNALYLGYDQIGVTSDFAYSELLRNTACQLI
jgi:glycosyltransferase involved in cell wall biosynthesis